MKATLFTVIVPKTEPGEVRAVVFICPKCGTDEVSRAWEHSMDRLFLMCCKCGYSASREPLDRKD